MTKLLAHFKRERKYSSHERWGIVVGLLGLSVIATIGGWMLVGSAQADSHVWMVKSIQYPVTVADDTDQVAKLELATADGTPAAGVWAGLRVTDGTLLSPDFTHEGWYSPIKNRTFFKTDSHGIVEFPLKSQYDGAIEFDVYTADPELSEDNRYTPLNYGFTVQFK